MRGRRIRGTPRSYVHGAIERENEHFIVSFAVAADVRSGQFFARRERVRLNQKKTASHRITCIACMYAIEEDICVLVSEQLAAIAQIDVADAAVDTHRG